MLRSLSYFAQWNVSFSIVSGRLHWWQVGCSSSLKKKIMGEMCMANFTSNGDNILVDIVMGCVYRGSQFLYVFFFVFYILFSLFSEMT